jgi:pyruvate dehydrogenase E2 component (dihydrolipoamide acetyltransferase)
MESGTIASWYLKEGDSFVAGDALAKIETDKASVDFEAQDDGVIAKILVPEGSEDIVVGNPILLTVDDASDVPAFENYIVDVSASKPAVSSSPPPPAEKTPVTTPPPKPAAERPMKVESAAVIPPPKASSPLLPEPVVVPPTNETKIVPTMSPVWGSSARVSSPLASTLRKQQKDYVEKYGSTGQPPL